MATTNDIANSREIQVNAAFSCADDYDVILGLMGVIASKYPPAYDWNFKPYSPAERILLCIYWLDTEVSNGGFTQFFSNSAGNNAMETLSSLQKIGASTAAAIFKEALSIFPNASPPLDECERHAFICNNFEVVRAKLWVIENEYYKIEFEIFASCVKYLRLHRSDFL